MADKSIAVIYTDGSARPQNGFIGWGAHGYIYTEDGICVKTGNKHPKNTCTDVGYVEKGSLLKIPHNIVKPTDYLDWCGYTDYNGTNNVAELLAIIKSLEKLYELGIRDVMLKSDSLYSLGILDKMYDTNKDRDSILRDVTVNDKYWKRIKDILDMYIADNGKLHFSHIRAHSTNIGNNKADKLALLGRIKSEKFRDRSEDYIHESIDADHPDEYEVFVTRPEKGYWKPKNDRHPALRFKQIYFFDDVPTNPDGSITYNILNYDDESEIGKGDLNVSYILYHTKNPVPRITEVRDIYNAKKGDVITTSTVRLDSLYNPNVLSLYEAFGEDIYIPEMKGKRLGITALRQDEDEYESLIMNEIYPHGLATSAEENMVVLTNMLSKYMDNRSTNGNVGYIDITDMFYDVNDGKCTIKKDFDNNITLVKVPFKTDNIEIEIPVRIGSDAPDRNTFKRIEKYQPKVTLMTKDFDGVKVEYCTVIEMNDGEIILYSNFYSRGYFIGK